MWFFFLKSEASKNINRLQIWSLNDTLTYTVLPKKTDQIRTWIIESSNLDCPAWLRQHQVEMAWHYCGITRRTGCVDVGLPCGCQYRFVSSHSCGDKKSKIPGSEIFYSCILCPFAVVNIGNRIVPCMDCNMFLGGTWSISKCQTTTNSRPVWSPDIRQRLTFKSSGHLKIMLLDFLCVLPTCMPMLCVSESFVEETVATWGVDMHILWWIRWMRTPECHRSLVTGKLLGLGCFLTSLLWIHDPWKIHKNHVACVNRVNWI